MTEFLFIGAHADDIEIGAGGTVAKLAEQDFPIGALILTDEADPQVRNERRAETRAALSKLGLQDDRIAFAGFPDGNLASTNETVSALRERAREHGFSPDIVVTHSPDSHNDHRAAYELSKTAFRECLYLRYEIVNSSMESEFHPRVFVDTTDWIDKKRAALDCHATQKHRGRIKSELIEEFSGKMGRTTGTEHAEGFEIEYQVGGRRRLGSIMKLNDSVFHRFWFSILEKQKLVYIHSVPVNRQVQDIQMPPNLDRTGSDILRSAFDEIWLGENPLRPIPSQNEGAVAHMRTDHVLLGGGAVNNAVTRQVFNHFPGIRYSIDYDMPDFKNIRIVDRTTHTKITAEYQQESFGQRSLLRDVAILTIMKSPYQNERNLLGCMGVHGLGAYGCYKALVEPEKIVLLMDFFKIPFDNENPGFQILLDIDAKTKEISLREESLHRIESQS